MTRMTHRWVVATLAGAAMFGAVAAYAGTIKIGATMRMISENGQKYGQMVVDEFNLVNESGGINGHMIDITLLNDECKSDKGVANANKLACEDKVHLIIGSTCSSVTLPIVDVTAKAQVPQIIPHSTNAKITQEGSEWVFRVPISARFYAGAAPVYVAENIGKRIAYVWATDAAAESETRGFMKVMKDKYGVDPVYKVRVQEKEIDFRSHMLKIKALKPDAIYVGALQGTMPRAFVQSYEVGIPPSVTRMGSSAASMATVPATAGDAATGVFYAAAYSAADSRPIAKLFNRMVKEKYGIHAPDHDFSQAWDLTQIVIMVLKGADLKLTDGALAEDRVAIRDAIASVENYEGLASGPISFCKDPTPQCRDGNRTPLLIQYTKGGENFQTEVLSRVTLPADYGLE